MNTNKKVLFISKWIKDYAESMPSKAESLVIGISGGIDSAFSACVAVDALGSDKVKGIMMPSKYTSDDSINDATLLGKNLNIEIEIDGGINFENYKIAIDAGANILVSGTTIFKSNNGNIKKNIDLLKLI